MENPEGPNPPTKPAPAPDKPVGGDSPSAASTVQPTAPSAPETAAAPAPAANWPGPPAMINPDNSKVEAILHRWLHSDIAGGPISRHTEAWNALQYALPSLAAMLQSEG